MKKVRTVVYFDALMHETLKTLSVKCGAPVAELVRRAVEQWLKRKRPRA